MKKQLTFWVALILGFVTHAQGQQTSQPVIKSAKVETSDLMNALEMSGYRFARFDFSDFLNYNYNYDFKFYYQEFDGKTLLEPKYFNVGTNREPVSVFSEEHRKQVLKSRGLPEDSKYFRQLTDMSIYLVPKSDSVTKLVLEIPEYGRFTPLMKLKPIVTPDFTFYMYESRPFELTAINLGENTPLMLYGSGWFDPKHNVCRMCGERELKKDMSSEILKDMPHYYIIGVKIEKAGEK